MKCSICEKEAVGVVSYCGNLWQWTCQDCAGGSNILNLSRGDKIITKNLSGGYPRDQELVNEHLTQNEIYTINTMYVDRSITHITIQEIPNIKFNSVHFTPLLSKPKQTIKIKYIEQYFEYLAEMCEDFSSCSFCPMTLAKNANCQRLTPNSWKKHVQVVQDYTNQKLNNEMENSLCKKL